MIRTSTTDEHDSSATRDAVRRVIEARRALRAYEPYAPRLHSGATDPGRRLRAVRPSATHGSAGEVPKH